MLNYNPFHVYCRELAPSAVSLTGDWAQGDDSKHDSHYNRFFLKFVFITCTCVVKWFALKQWL